MTTRSGKSPPPIVCTVRNTRDTPAADGGTIAGDENQEGTYTAGSVSCLNVQSDKFCSTIYKDSKVAAGGKDERPEACFGTATTIDTDLKNGSIATCPKTCGYCCKTKAFTCENARIPFQACDTISPQQCLEPTWRALNERDCPATCGLCNMGGCIDTSAFCNRQHCVTKGLETFVAANCKKTCDMCTATATTASPGATTRGVVANCIDHKNCASWVRKGFCTNAFYDANARKASCPKACGLC